MPALLILVNYLVTLFVGIGALSGRLPIWIVVVLPIAIFLQYRVYRASERAFDPARL